GETAPRRFEFTRTKIEHEVRRPAGFVRIVFRTRTNAAWTSAGAQLVVSHHDDAMILARDDSHAIVTGRRTSAVDQLLASPAVRLVAEAARQREQFEARRLVHGGDELAVVTAPSLAPVVAKTIWPVVESEAVFPSAVGMGPRAERAER